MTAPKLTAAQRRALVQYGFAVRIACPDCENDGPHDGQYYCGDFEYACAACGMQHLVPDEYWATPARRAALEGAS